MRVLYERHGSGAGAFGLIDDGHIHAWRELGAEVRVWRSMDPSEPPLRELLASFRPTHLLANLQTARRAPSAWLGASDLDALERVRGETGLRVAARSAPSNLADLMRGADIAFDRFDGAGTTSYYTQPVRPVGTEREALERGLIDVVRSPAHAACYPVAFRSFLDMGVSVVEEMHAADATRYRPLSASEAEHSAEVLFIGNCWPFKWAQMAAYVRGLRARFGDRFVIRGNGWPREAGALGPIADEGVGAANPMNRLANGASVQVALHEPTQVLPFPFTGNERPYKLMLMEALPPGGPVEGRALGEAVRALHAASGEAYGWSEDYAFAEVAIPNAPAADWPTFWAQRRLLPALPALPTPLGRRVERLAQALDARLPAAPRPALLHGDLWGGNVHGGAGRVWLIDPACFHGDAEVDLAMLSLFGRPPPGFADAYGALDPGWEERRPIYQLWPALNHVRLFGAGYHGMVDALLDAAGV